MTFSVIDKQTGDAPDLEKITYEEEWAKGLIYCDMDGFLMREDGTLVLADECGNWTSVPPDRFEVVWHDN